MSNRPMPSTPKAYFKELTILFFALILGEVTFFCVAFFIDAATPELHEMFKLPVSIFAAITILSAPFLYQKVLEHKLKNQTSLISALQAYRTANIVRWSLLQSANMFILVAFFLTGQSFYIYLFLAGLVVLLLAYPTLDKCVADLKLNAQQKEKLTRNIPFDEL